MTYPEIGDIIKSKKGDYKMDTNIFSIETYSEERLKINRTLGKYSPFIDMPTDSRTMEKSTEIFMKKTISLACICLDRLLLKTGRKNILLR